MTYTATSEDTAQSATRRLPELPQVGEDYPSAYPDLVPTNAEDMAGDVYGRVEMDARDDAGTMHFEVLAYFGTARDQE